MARHIIYKFLLFSCQYLVFADTFFHYTTPFNSLLEVQFFMFKLPYTVVCLQVLSSYYGIQHAVLSG